MDNQLIHEVEESLRQERLQEMWKEYGPYILAGCVLAVLFTGFSALYRNYERRINTAQTEAVIEAMSDPDPAAALDKTITALRPGARALAFLNQAGVLLKKDKKNEALAVYDRAAADTSLPDPFRSLAVLLETRLAWSMKGKIDAPISLPLKGKNQGESAKILVGQLQPLIADGANPWRNYARVQAALIAAHDLKDYSQARIWLAPVRNGGDEISAGLRQRAQVLDTVYAAQGGKEPK